jgi:hypothetical protein
MSGYGRCDQRKGITMSNSKFPLEEPIRRRLRVLGGRGEPTAEGTEPRASDPDRVSDPMALDPLSPIAVDPGSAESADPFALDPLSPFGRDAG